MKHIDDVILEEMENELIHLRNYMEESLDVLFSRINRLKGTVLTGEKWSKNNINKSVKKMRKELGESTETIGGQDGG